MSRVPLILFSGGLDSTYLLHDRLLRGDVETLYVAASQCPKKIKRELAARKKIIDYLNKHCEYSIRRDNVVHLDIDTQNGPVMDCSWAQPFMWLTGALKISDGDFRHSCLEVGYVSGDSILSRLHNITQAWEHLQAFTKHHPIPIQFPLQTRLKHDMLRTLHVPLWEHIWVCEMPVKPKGRGKRNYVACGECPACDTQAASLFLFERKFKKTYQQHVQDYYHPPTQLIEEETITIGELDDSRV
jgi:7-cyano-7-deazaguanine synthase in queuosine biosynthesis